MRFPVYSINMTIRDYNNLLIRAGTNDILFDFSLKLRRELLNHNSGAYRCPSHFFTTDSRAFVETSVMSFEQNSTPEKFDSKVSRASGSLSRAYTISIPASLNPLQLPPQPEKKSKTLIGNSKFIDI